MEQKFTIKNEFGLEDCHISLLPGDRVFFYGDLGAGKSTYIRSLLRNYFLDPDLVVRSPTYTYYEKYTDQKKSTHIYHFDLYRIEDYSTFISIGGEDILEDLKSIMLIEWPERIEGYIKPTKVVRIEIGENEARNIIIEVL